MKKLLAAVIAAALVVGFLGYTKTGARAMASLGLTTACSTGDGC